MQEGGVSIWEAMRKQEEVYRRGTVTELGWTEEGDGGAGEMKWRRQSQEVTKGERHTWELMQ